MAFAYGADDISVALFLCLLTQGALFGLLVTRGYRRLTEGWSAMVCAVFAMIAITGSTALYNAVFPLFVGWGSIFVTLIVIAPLTLVNSIVFTVRAFAARPKWEGALLSACVVPLNLGYWAILFWPRSS